MNQVQDLQKHAVNVRKNIVKMVTAAKSGHPGGSLSSVEILLDVPSDQFPFAGTSEYA